MNHMARRFHIMAEPLRQGAAHNRRRIIRQPQKKVFCERTLLLAKHRLDKAMRESVSDLLPLKNGRSL